MATGFGCMVVGPAGSGKVSDTRYELRLQILSVHDVPHSATGGRAARKNTQGLQSWPCSWGIQIYLWHRHQRPNFTRRCLRARKLWAKRRPCLLHGTLGWEHWVAHRWACRILRWVIHPLWLPGANWTLFTSRRDDTPCCGNHQDWFQHVRRLLCRWNKLDGTHEVHRNLSHLRVHHVSGQPPTHEHPHQVRQDRR